eukprot:1705843-Amphidinium_carterae.1
MVVKRGVFATQIGFGPGSRDGTKLTSGTSDLMHRMLPGSLQASAQPLLSAIGWRSLGRTAIQPN